jgi:hypothetical protein
MQRTPFAPIVKTRMPVLFALLGTVLLSACDKTAKPSADVAEPAGKEAPAPAVAEAPAPEVVAPSRTDEAKALMGGMMAALERMTVAFEGVKDEASAKTAAEVIITTTSELTELGGKARALKGQMSAEEQKTMEEDPTSSDIQEKMQSISQRLSKAGAALPQDPAVQKAIMPAMQSFGEAMRAMSGYLPPAAPEGE